MTLGSENTGDCIESYTEAERQWKFDLPIVLRDVKQPRAVVLAEKFVTRETPELLVTLS